MLYGTSAPRNGESGVCFVRMFLATGSRRLAGMMFPGKAKPLDPHFELAVDGSKMAPVSTVRLDPSQVGEGAVVVLPVRCSVKSPAFSLAVQLVVKPG